MKIDNEKILSKPTNDIFQIKKTINKKSKKNVYQNNRNLNLISGQLLDILLSGENTVNSKQIFRRDKTDMAEKISFLENYFLNFESNPVAGSSSNIYEIQETSEQVNADDILVNNETTSDSVEKEPYFNLDNFSELTGSRVFIYFGCNQPIIDEANKQIENIENSGKQLEDGEKNFIGMLTYKRVVTFGLAEDSDYQTALDKYNTIVDNNSLSTENIQNMMIEELSTWRSNTRVELKLTDAIEKKSQMVSEIEASGYDLEEDEKNILFSSVGVNRDYQKSIDQIISGIEKIRMFNGEFSDLSFEEKAYIFNNHGTDSEIKEKIQNYRDLQERYGDIWKHNGTYSVLDFSEEEYIVRTKFGDLSIEEEDTLNFRGDFKMSSENSLNLYLEMQDTYLNDIKGYFLPNSFLFSPKDYDSTKNSIISAATAISDIENNGVNLSAWTKVDIIWDSINNEYSASEIKDNYSNGKYDILSEYSQSRRFF